MRRGRGCASVVAVLVIATAMVSASCGAVEGSGESDARPPADGSSSDLCTMNIAVTPAAPTAPANVTLEGSIVRDGQLSGTEQFQFSVTFDGAVVSTTDLDPYDGSRVSFQAEAHGPYRVELQGAVGSTDCTDGLEFVNVSDPTADHEIFRFRFAPAADQPAPVQERLFAIPGGADYALGTVGLESGVEVNGHVRDQATAPLAAYLRIAIAGAALCATEIFADESGAFRTRLATGSYDLLVVPAANTVAPELRTAIGVAAFGAISLSAGDAITGVVLGPGGAPLQGARVSLRVDDVPSSIAVTGAAGDFVVLAHAGGGTGLTAKPPDGSGLPRLELATGAGLVAAAGTPLTVGYSSGLSSRTVSFDVTQSDGSTAAPGARVTFIARSLADAGTVTPEGGAGLAARGELRVTAEADAGGALPALLLPEAVYDVVIEPGAAVSGQAVRLAALDLSPGVAAPPSLALAQAATVTGQAVDDTQSGVEGVKVTAVPRGLLANVASASATAITAADGGFVLSLVGGGEYDLVLEPRGSAHARLRSSGVVAPPAGESDALAAIELPKAISVSGRVEIPGVAGGAAGVHVMALCHDCAGVVAATPVAEAVTGVGGRFVLAIPDPGVGE